MSSFRDVPRGVALLRGLLRLGGCPRSSFYVAVNWKRGEAKLDRDTHACAVPAVSLVCFGFSSVAEVTLRLED